MQWSPVAQFHLLRVTVERSACGIKSSIKFTWSALDLTANRERDVVALRDMESMLRLLDDLLKRVRCEASCMACDVHWMRSFGCNLLDDTIAPSMPGTMTVAG